jgi:hypothetical protein
MEMRSDCIFQDAMEARAMRERRFKIDEEHFFDSVGDVKAKKLLTIFPPSHRFFLDTVDS